MTTEDFDTVAFKKVVPEHEEFVVENRSYILVKRVIDLFLFFLLVFPVIIIVFFSSILIMIDSDGPAIYRQRRVGRKGKYFYVNKLRTMYEDAELSLPYTDKDDPRITRIGRFLRRFRIDELPQVFNVFTGNMSFIGPRPLTVYEYQITDDAFKKRLIVLPGITGWAQVNGGNELSNSEKLKYDIEYIEKISLHFDLRIVLKTLHIIINGNGSR